MRYFLMGAALTAAALAVSGAISIPIAQAFNPSEVPPWGTGPNPNGTPNAAGNPPVSGTQLPIPVVVQPAVPTVVVPTGSDKFSLFKTDGTSVDVTDKVFLFLDQKTGSQFIVFMMLGQPPIMVKR